MRDFNRQEDVYRDFERLVHGIESNKKNLLEVARRGKEEDFRDCELNLEQIIKAQERLLNEMSVKIFR